MRPSDKPLSKRKHRIARPASADLGVWKGMCFRSYKTVNTGSRPNPRIRWQIGVLEKWLSEWIEGILVMGGQARSHRSPLLAELIQRLGIFSLAPQKRTVIQGRVYTSSFLWSHQLLVGHQRQTLLVSELRQQELKWKWPELGLGISREGLPNKSTVSCSLGMWCSRIALWDLSWAVPYLHSKL